MKRSWYLFAAACALALAFGLPVRAADEPAKVAGKWELSAESPRGPMTSTLNIEQDGEKIKGKLQGPQREVPFEGSVKGKKIAFTVKGQSPQGEITVEYSGTVEGDTIKGTRKGPRGDTEWTAKRMK